MKLQVAFKQRPSVLSSQFGTPARVVRSWLSVAIVGIASITSITVSAQNLTPPVQLTTQNLLAPSGAYLPSVNIDSAGNVEAVWSAAILSAAAPGIPSSIELTEAVISATGALQTNLLMPAAPVADGAFYPQVRTDAAGNSTAVWLQYVASTTPGTVGGSNLMSADKPAGGAWNMPVIIQSYATAGDAPHFSMNSKGDAIITIGTTYTKRVAGSKTWSSFLSVATIANAIDPLITSVSVGSPTMGENGDAIVQWFGSKVVCSRRCYVTITEYRIARLPSTTTTWQHSGTFAGGISGLTMDKQGRVMAIVPGTNAAGVYEIRSVTQLGAGKPWSAPVAILTPVDNYYGAPPVYGVGSDDAGNVTVVYPDLRYTNAVKSITGNMATNKWAASEFINGFAVTSPSLLRVSANGAALLTSGNIAMIRPSVTSPWGGAVTLDSTGAVEPRAAAINANGQAVIIASKLDAATSGYQLYAVTGSNTGPTLLPSQVLPAAPDTVAQVPVTVNTPYGPQYVVPTDSITISWTNRAYNADSFYIERCKVVTAGVPCTDFQQIAFLPVNVTTYKDTNVVHSSTYLYRVNAGNAAGYSAYSVVAYGLTAIPTPAAPSSVIPVATSPTTTTVTWTDNATDEVSYFVQRCVIPPGSYTWASCVKFEVPANTTTFNDTGLLVGYGYIYRITAHGALGDSWFVDSGPVTMPVELPPASPTGATATATSPTTVTLNWIDNANNESVQYIGRCLNINSCAVFTVAANVTTFNDTGLQPGKSYFYTVVAYNAAGYVSATFAQTTPVTTLTGTTSGGGTKPAAPTALVSGSIARTQVVLNWTDNANNEQKFQIERCKGANCTNFSQVGTVNANATTFTDTNKLSRNTAYSYRVLATNTSGSSGYSNVLAVTTLP